MASDSGLDRAGINYWDTERKRWWKPEELKELMVSCSDVLQLANLVEAQFVTMTLTEYQTMPGILMDAVRVCISQRQKKDKNGLR